MIVGVNGIMWIKTEELPDLIFLKRLFSQIGELSRENVIYQIQEYFENKKNDSS